VSELFNTFWHGRSLSPLELTCMRSFIAHGHRLRVFSYDELALPAGVENADARRILPAERFFTFEDSPSAFTNIFRYRMLLEQGGWWIDTDVLCRTADIPACDYYWAEQELGQVNGAVIRFPPSDALCRRLLQEGERRADRLSFWGQLGPALLTEVLPEAPPAGHAGSTNDVYPIHWLQTHFFWLPEFASVVESRTRQSTFVHLWHSLFGKMGIDVHARPPEGSYLDSQYTLYGGAEPSSGEPPDRDAVIRFLRHKWVPKTWCDKCGRDMEELGISEMLASMGQTPGTKHV